MKFVKRNYTYATLLFLFVFSLILTDTVFAADNTYWQDHKEALQELEVDGKPPTVIPIELIPAEDEKTAALRSQYEKMVDDYASRMIEMTEWLYNNPESGYYEFNASKLLGGELEKHGFEVTYGVEGLEEGYNSVIQERFNAAGLPTALVAKYKGKTEHPVICFLFEADALRAPAREKGAFHGCQHNMQGPTAVGSAINFAKLLEENNISGSVWAILTPAEEIPPPDKSAMAKAGVFDGIDIVFFSHGFGPTAKRSEAGLGNCCYLIDAALYEFHGKTAHGSNAWNGADALDAARLFLTGIDMLREHSEPEFRMMSAITKTGAAPNVVDDLVQVDHWNRMTDPAGQEALEKKAQQIDQIARGVAMATFTEADIRHYAYYYNGIEYGWLNALKWVYVNEYGDAEAISEEFSKPSGWAECGYPSVNFPGVTIAPAIAGTPEVAGHSDENADLTISEKGHKALVQTSKIEGAVALRLVLDPKLLSTVKEEQKRWQTYGLEKGLLTEDMIRK